MNETNRAGYHTLAATSASNPTHPIDEDRAIPRAMAGLASAIGDLESATRALAGRVSRLIPGGSPFDSVGKERQGRTTTVATAIRSHHCDELENRACELSEITARINEMVQNIEV